MTTAHGEAGGSPEASPTLSPTSLALLLAAGLLGLLLLLSLLAPTETSIGLERMEELVSQDMVERVEVAEGRLIGRLRQPVVIEQAGHRVLAKDVILPMPEGALVLEALARWRTSGVTVVMGADNRRWLRELAWLAVVGGLLLFGLYNLVQQARRHRREGSPRERLARARQDLEEGRLTQAEFERRVSEITPEL
jgi:hypothetical protein